MTRCTTPAIAFVLVGFCLGTPPASAQADLAVTAAALPDPADSGATTTYTITVSNAGPDTDPTVTLDIVFPGWGMPFPGDAQTYEEAGYSGLYGGTFTDGQCGWIRWVDGEGTFINPGMQCTFVLDPAAYADVEINTPLKVGPPPYAVSGVTVVDPPAIAGDYDSMPADGWGQAWDGTWSMTEPLGWADVDGGPPLTPADPRTACDANLVDLTGKVAFIDRGGCEFGTKGLNAETAGASAALVANTIPGQAIFAMGGGADGPYVTIPVAMLSYEDGQILRQYIDGGVQITVETYFPTTDWKLQSTFYTRDPTNDPDCPAGDCNPGSNNTFFHTLTVNSTLLWGDGFESGDASHWSSSVP
jgi:hypothetical protein